MYVWGEVAVKLTPFSFWQSNVCVYVYVYVCVCVCLGWGVVKIQAGGWGVWGYLLQRTKVHI